MALLLIGAIVATMGTSCGPPPRQGPQDPFFNDDAPSPVAGNFDDAEARWRSEVEHGRSDDPDALLKDDPPDDPEHYGNVAFKEEPKTFWGKVKAGAETVGRASFAAATVLVTLGMMVAPYLLL